MCLSLTVIVVYAVLLYFEIQSIRYINLYTGGLLNSNAIPWTMLIFTVLNIILAIIAIASEFKCCHDPCARCGQQVTRYIVWVLLSIGQTIIFLVPLAIFIFAICFAVGFTTWAFDYTSDFGNVVTQSSALFVFLASIPCVCCLLCTCMMFRATHLARPRGQKEHFPMTSAPAGNTVVVLQQ